MKERRHKGVREEAVRSFLTSASNGEETKNGGKQRKKDPYVIAMTRR